jgi:hypothetical protein
MVRPWAMAMAQQRAGTDAERQAAKAATLDAHVQPARQHTRKTEAQDTRKCDSLNDPILLDYKGDDLRITYLHVGIGTVAQWMRTHEGSLPKEATLAAPSAAPVTLMPIGRAAAEDEVKDVGAGRRKCGCVNGQVNNGWDQDCTKEPLQLGTDLDALAKLTSPENWRDLMRSGRNVDARGKKKKVTVTQRPQLPGISSFGPSKQGTAAAAWVKRGRSTRTDGIAKITKPSLSRQPAPGV